MNSTTVGYIKVKLSTINILFKHLCKGENSHQGQDMLYTQLLPYT